MTTNMELDKVEEQQPTELEFNVGGRLRRIRETYGMSQRALAKRTGVANGLISMIELGRTSPSVATLKKILEGVPADARRIEKVESSFGDGSSSPSGGRPSSSAPATPTTSTAAFRTASTISETMSAKS